MSEFPLVERSFSPSNGLGSVPIRISCVSSAELEILNHLREMIGGGVVQRDRSCCSVEPIGSVRSTSGEGLNEFQTLGGEGGLVCGFYFFF